MDPCTSSLDDIIKTTQAAQLGRKNVAQEGADTNTEMFPLHTSNMEWMDKSLDEIINERNLGISSRHTPTVVKEESLSSSRIILDPLTSSLGDIITASTSSSREAGTKRKLSSMHDDVTEGSEGGTNPLMDRRVRPAKTAYRAVGLLSKAGLLIEMQIGRMTNCDNNDRSHMWRCHIKCDGVEAVADSIRKVVAREMAAAEFLRKLLVAQPDSKIPKYEVMDEIFIDPKIRDQLNDLATDKGLHVTYEVKLKPSTPQDVLQYDSYFVFSWTYYVGNATYTGESCVLEYAGLIAAKQAFSELFGRTLYPTRYFIGEDCTPPEDAYDYMENEVFQIVKQEVGVQSGSWKTHIAPSVESTQLGRGRG